MAALCWHRGFSQPGAPGAALGALPIPSCPSPAPRFGKTKAQKPIGVQWGAVSQLCILWDRSSVWLRCRDGDLVGIPASPGIPIPPYITGCRWMWGLSGSLWSCSRFGTTEDGVMPSGCGAVKGSWAHIQPRPQNDLQSPGCESTDCHVQQTGPCFEGPLCLFTLSPH